MFQFFLKRINLMHVYWNPSGQFSGQRGCAIDDLLDTRQCCRDLEERKAKWAQLEKEMTEELENTGHQVAQLNVKVSRLQKDTPKTYQENQKTVNQKLEHRVAYYERQVKALKKTARKEQEKTGKLKYQLHECRKSVMSLENHLQVLRIEKDKLSAIKGQTQVMCESLAARQAGIASEREAVNQYFRDTQEASVIDYPQGLDDLQADLDGETRRTLELQETYNQANASLAVLQKTSDHFKCEMLILDEGNQGLLDIYNGMVDGF